MPAVTESVWVSGSLAEVWGLYFEPSEWPSWVDGFARVESSDGYPERGGTLRWASTPAGRGTVEERVLEHDPRRRHRVAFTDPESEGELLTTFEIGAGPDDAATLVVQQFTYRLREAGPLTRLTDVFFIRPQIRRSLRRSLDRFTIEPTERASR